MALEVISFNGIIFVDNETGKEVEGILYKKSELEEDEDKEDENISDSDDFDDYDDDNDDNNDDDNDDDDFEDNNKKKKKEDLWYIYILKSMKDHAWLLGIDINYYYYYYYRE